MAQLSSPGVSVTVVDESFYTPAAPGTVPLIVVASQENKQNAAGTGTAAGTLKANAGKVYLLTSQMDLGTTFGVPYFQTDASNNPVHAGELNEYGLQAAYSFLGVSNRAYVVRADIDTGQLVGDAIEPRGEPENGTFWFDINATNFGVFEWNGSVATSTGGQKFSAKEISIITDSANLSTPSDLTSAPAASFGAVGDYVIVAVTNLNTLWFKKYKTDTNAGIWVQVGSEEWKASWPTVTTTAVSPTLTATGISFTGYIADANSTTLSVISAVTGDSISVGDVISSASGNITANTRISAHNTASFSGYIDDGDGNGIGTGTTLTVTAGTDPTVGMVIAGGSTAAYTRITAHVSGTGVGSKWTTSGTAQLVGSSGSPQAFTGESWTIDQNTLDTVNGTITTGGDTLYVNDKLITGVTYDVLIDAINDLGITGLTAADPNQSGTISIYSTGVNVKLSGTILAKLFGKVSMSETTWYAPLLQVSPHYTVPEYKSSDSYPRPTGSMWIKTTAVNQGADWIIKKFNSATSTWVEQPVKLASSGESALASLDPKGGGINLAVGTIYVKTNDFEASPVEATFKIYRRIASGQTVLTSKTVTTSTLDSGMFTQGFTMSWSVPGSSDLQTFTIADFSAAGTAADAASLVSRINAEISTAGGVPYIVAALGSNNTIVITHKTGGEIKFVDGSHTPITKLFPVDTTANLYANPNGISGEFVGTLWSAVSLTDASVGFAPATTVAPTTIPANGTLWYNTVVDEVDIMIHDGSKWVGYLSSSSPFYAADPLQRTNPNGPIVSATKPTAQSDGSGLKNGDIWVDTTDFDNFPHIYKWNADLQKWVLVDNADQTTENGILFHDARWGVSGAGSDTASTIAELLTSDYVDPDAPDPALYPKGMLLWNLRRSGNNVLKFEQNYIDTTERNPRIVSNGTGESMASYYAHRWVSQAPNQLDGSGTFGRKSQRAVVLTAIEALIQSNQQIRDEDSRQFNLISCPGYLETLSSLIDLNTSRGETAFIVADTPARLTPDATSLANWGNNVAAAAVDGEQGLVATNSYAAVYYPWGYTTDLLGNNIVVPPSHIMLRTIALSDNVSYPWFAPAGVRRGGVTNASSVGYVDPLTGEFNTVALNTGQRDTLATVHVNPITYIAGTGLVAYGQKTRQLVASSLDRINVARLVIYLRYQLNQIAKPFVFEPNDTITRNEIKNQIEALLLELTGQRALYDYIVVCDTSNNTPARIDANELHVDIAIEPVKAVEFIYIPLRLENTGAIKALG